MPLTPPELFILMFGWLTPEVNLYRWELLFGGCMLLW